MSDSFKVVEVDNPNLRSGDKGTSVGAEITSTPFDANTEATHVDIIDSAGSRELRKLTTAAYHVPALAAVETYILMVDLDNTGGDYNHVGSSSIKIGSVSASLVKSSIGAKWRSIVGIIVLIDGTAATVHWLDASTLFALDTSAVEQHKTTVLPIPADLAVSGGELEQIVGGYIQAGITALNTGTTINNVAGNLRTPAVGDLILRITQDSGGGSAEVAYSTRYLVD